MKTAVYQNKPKIPQVSRDGNLISRLLPIIIVGSDRILGNESCLYLRLLTRLVDKAFDEYTTVANYLTKEIEINDKLTFRLEIINHLENCINAISRVSKILNILKIGIIRDKLLIKKNIDLTKLIDQKLLRKLRGSNIVSVRNRVEHIDEDIYLGELKQGIFLDIDSNYEKICIKNKCVSLSQLVIIIESYHKLVLGMFDNLSNLIKLA